MSNSAMAASGLRKAYGDKIVLDGIDLDVRAGTVFSLLGPHGAGETTTVNVLTTLVKADGGPVRVAGHVITSMLRRLFVLVEPNGQVRDPHEYLGAQGCVSRLGRRLPGSHAVGTGPHGDRRPGSRARRGFQRGCSPDPRRRP